MLETPVLFLIFNRPDTTARVFEQIKLAKPRQLFIAADGPRDNKIGEDALCKETRSLVIDNIDWECDVKTFFRETNAGCKDIANSINWFFEHVSMGIILEDDCLPSQSFFPFCEELLLKYADNFKIMSICGYSIFDDAKNETADYFFNRLGGIWGWATWKRAWANYEYTTDYDKKVFKILNNNYLQKFYWNTARFNNDKNWDISWFYNMLCLKGIGITSYTSLVQNIGVEGTNMSDPNNPIHKIQNHTIDTRNLRHPSSVSIDEKMNADFIKEIERIMRSNENIIIDFKNFLLKGPRFLKNRFIK